MKWLIPAAALTVAAAAALAARRGASLAVVTFDGPAFDASTDSNTLQADEADQLPTFMESVAVTLNPSTYSPAGVDDSTAARNLRAFLDMIGYSEGAGYATLVGGGTFGSFADHPRQYVQVRPGLVSSAAGKYQILAKTWDPLRARLGLPDFGPASQDAAAVELIRERGALNDVKAGRFAVAIDKCRGCWASLPGAPYGQPTHAFTELQAVYLAGGGTLSA